MADGGISKRFFAVISSILNVGDGSLTPQSSRDTLEEWDSVKHMYVMLALEEEFGIEFTDDEIANLASVSDLMNAMTAKTGRALSWQ